MGVRGLTNYIARNAEQFLQPYELHDCNLVIDGDNLACNLYKDVTGIYSAFGGDYDDFYSAVLRFFHVLAECNVHAYVLMDGGYEHKKLRTVAKRLRGKIALIKRINPTSSMPIFPVLLKEVFVDAVRTCGVPVMRCIFEADDELAALSRKLHCPVLSYDSDFYIYNVRYIPLITVTMKAHTKIVKLKEVANAQDTQQEESVRALRKNEAKHLGKRTKANRVMSQIQVDNVDKKVAMVNQKNIKTYKYIDCCIYRVENLIKRRALSKEKLPLFAALLGNDYIARSAFRNFFVAGMGKMGRSRKSNQQQRRIKMILHFLKNETLETAQQKIFTRLKQSQRESLMSQVEAAVSGYSNEKCYSFDFFKQNYENTFNEFTDFIDYETDEDNEDSELAINVTDTDSDEFEDEQLDENVDQKQLVENVEISSDNESDKINDGADNELVNVDNADIDNEDDNTKFKLFPAWFLKKLYSANLPRFCVDLFYLRKYINSPQAEHFLYNDCNEVALPILIYTFTLMHSAVGDQPATSIYYEADGITPKPIEFTYVTRATRVTNIRYFHFAKGATPKFAFDPNQPNAINNENSLLLFRQLFEDNISKELNVVELFTSVNELPKDLRLYFLSIIYWLQMSQHCDLPHLQALLICLVVLRTIDKKLIPVERDIKKFQKYYGKIIKKEQNVRINEALTGSKRKMKPEIASLPICERIEFVSKSDCLLVQNNLLKYFHMPEIFKKKYDLFTSTVVHAFAEFQAILFQLHALNSLLDAPFERPQIGYLFSGVFLYNLYDLLKARTDLHYYVENFIFSDSPLMFEFYVHLCKWCETFIPSWKLKAAAQNQKQMLTKNQARKRRQAARKEAEKATNASKTTNGANNTNGIRKVDENGNKDAELTEDDDFYDLNNKFCMLLKVS